MEQRKWLDGYTGQTADALIALASSHRIDSIVLAFEQAIQSRVPPGDRDALADLTDAELTVLAVEAMEREVNNGGYHQFFLNTPEFAPPLLAALERIGCPGTAAISADAIALIGLHTPFTAEQVEAALRADHGGRLIETLSDKCDGRYYESGEPIADRLFEYIGAHRADIRIPA